jgi:hypothetical protein
MPGDGWVSGQQAELADRVADVGEGPLAPAVDWPAEQPTGVRQHRLIVVAQASGLHQPGDEPALSDRIAPPQRNSNTSRFQELSLAEPGMGGPGHVPCHAWTGLVGLLGEEETGSRVPVLE